MPEFGCVDQFGCHRLSGAPVNPKRSRVPDELGAVSAGQPGHESLVDAAGRRASLCPGALPGYSRLTVSVILTTLSVLSNWTGRAI